jgi:hypothetical protein
VAVGAMAEHDVGNLDEEVLKLTEEGFIRLDQEG